MRRLGTLSVAACVTIAVPVALTGCTGDDPGAEPPPATSGAPASPAPATGPPPTNPSAGTSSPTGPSVDCAAVEDARRGLRDATNAELERLGIDRSDPRAFNVQVVVTGQQSAAYWTAVRDALPPDATDLRAVADTVVGYWAPLAPRLAAIEIADGSEAAVQAATDEYLQISTSTPDDAVLAAQHTLGDGIDAACGAVVVP